MDAPVEMSRGFLFTAYKAPLQTDMDSTRFGSKRGRADSAFLQFFVLPLAFGDASAEKAARDGDIETVSHLDYRHIYVLGGIYQQITIYAYGE